MRERTVGRLSLYRRVLRDMLADGVESVYSHELAARSGVTSAQVRRDVMSVGCQGSPIRGYDVRALLAAIGDLLDPPTVEDVALVGVGNLGRAILTYFAGRTPKLRILAAFDRDPEKAGRVIHGCRCHPVEDLRRIVPELGIKVAILAVPAAEAQQVADALLLAGVKGLMNFAPARLRVPPDVWVENIDLTISLEKVAFFARSPARGTEQTK